MLASESELSIYSARDCVIQRRLYDNSVRHLASIHNGPQLMALQTRLGLIADEMTWRGVRIDQEKRAEHNTELTKRINAAEQKFLELATAVGKPDINPGSGPQLCRFFFEHLGVDPIKYSETTGKPSLDEAVLTAYVSHNNPIVSGAAKVLLSRRKWSTMRNTHVTGLRVDKHGVAHPFWRPGGAVTGRWSSSSPNMMNVPKPVQVKKEVVHEGLRNMYVPHDPNGWVTEADYKQIELRIVALLAGCKAQLDAFAQGKDPHSQNARALFYPEGYDGEVSKKERTLAKNFCYLANYGGSPHKLWQTILPTFPTFTISKATRLLDKYFQRNPEIRAWQKKVISEAVENGYVTEPMSGRRRIFWGPVNPNEVVNYPVQTAAGHIINIAIQQVYAALDWPNEGIMFQLHDALILDGPDPLRLAEILTEKMAVEVELNGQKATFPVDVSVGKNWAGTKEMSLEEVRKLC